MIKDPKTKKYFYVITATLLIASFLFVILVFAVPISADNKPQGAVNETAWEKFDRKLNHFRMQLRDGMSVFLPGTARRR